MMKRMVFAVVLALLFVSQAVAQMPMGGGQPGSQTGSAQPGGAAPGGMMGGMMPGMMGGGMMCPMMSGGMGMMPMMGMMGGAQDPKMLGRMLQMRADMMRAMADVLAKHGKALEEGK